jgi:hypothetical protein
LSASGLMFIAAAALLTAIADILLRIGVVQAGGLDLSSEGFIHDLSSLCQQALFIGGILLYGLATLSGFALFRLKGLCGSREPPSPLPSGVISSFTSPCHQKN